nr:transposase [Saccharopolyspora spinosa]
MRTVRAELTDRLLIFGERHLRAALTEYIRHYNGRRPHRARELRPPRPSYPVADLGSERIKPRPALGGLINEYERIAQRRRSGMRSRFLEPHRYPSNVPVVNQATPGPVAVRLGSFPQQP